MKRATARSDVGDGAGLGAGQELGEDAAGVDLAEELDPGGVGLTRGSLCCRIRRTAAEIASPPNVMDSSDAKSAGLKLEDVASSFTR